METEAEIRAVMIDEVLPDYAERPVDPPTLVAAHPSEIEEDDEEDEHNYEVSSSSESSSSSDSDEEEEDEEDEKDEEAWEPRHEEESPSQKRKREQEAEEEAEAEAKRARLAEHEPPEGHVMCPVCMEDLPEGDVFSVCLNNHTLCFTCLFKLGSRSLCPVCRGEMCGNTTYFHHMSGRDLHVVPLISSVDGKTRFLSPLEPVLNDEGFQDAYEFNCSCVEPFVFSEPLDLTKIRLQFDGCGEIMTSGDYEMLLRFDNKKGTNLYPDYSDELCANILYNRKGVVGTAALHVRYVDGKPCLANGCAVHNALSMRRQVPFDEMTEVFSIVAMFMRDLAQLRK